VVQKRAHVFLPEGLLADIDQLFGKGRYIEHKPDCPAGGAYAINAVEDKCTCNLPRHEDEP